MLDTLQSDDVWIDFAYERTSVFHENTGRLMVIGFDGAMITVMSDSKEDLQRKRGSLDRDGKGETLGDALKEVKGENPFSNRTSIAAMKFISDITRGHQFLYTKRVSRPLGGIIGKTAYGETGFFIFETKFGKLHCIECFISVPGFPLKSRPINCGKSHPEFPEGITLSEHPWEAHVEPGLLVWRAKDPSEAPDGSPAAYDIGGFRLIVSGKHLVGLEVRLTRPDENGSVMV